MARSARQVSSVLAGDDFTPEEQAAFDAMHAEAPEAAPEAATAPEPAAAADPAPVEEEAASEAETAPQERPGMVPSSRFKEESERRKAAEKEFAEYRQRTEDRFTQILQRFSQPQPAAQPAPATPEIPDVTKDPIAHFQAKFDAQQREIERLTQGTRQSQQLSQQQSIAQAVQLTAQAQENEYRAATPDYNDAAAFLRQSRHQELADLGFTNAAEREAMIGQEALQIAGRAIQNGANFPAMIYKLAQGRGYKNAPAATGEPAPQADAEQRLTRQAAGQQQARSLSAARGTAPQEMTAQRLASMSEREFDAWLSKATPEQQRAVFGA